jgi:hypothetical protein
MTELSQQREERKARLEKALQEKHDRVKVYGVSLPEDPKSKDQSSKSDQITISTDSAFNNNGKLNGRLEAEGRSGTHPKR